MDRAGVERTLATSGPAGPLETDPASTTRFVRDSAAASTPLTLHAAFALLGITPDGARAVSDIARFEIDDTSWLALVFVAVAGIMIWLRRRHVAAHLAGPRTGTEVWKPGLAIGGVAVLLGGAVAWLLAGGG